MEIVGKISVKTVCGNPRKILGTMPTVPLMQILGEVIDIETGKSDKFKTEAGEPSEWIRLVGQFKAQNILTKQNFFSANCFLPNVVSDLIVSQFKAARAIDVNYRLQFAFQIGVKEDENTATGYVYWGKSLMPQSEEHNPFKAIESQVQAQAAGIEHKPESAANENNPGGVKDPSEIPFTN